MTEHLPSSPAGLEKQLEFRTAERRQRESLFRTLAQVAPVGIFRTDALGGCTYVNERYCRISGLSQEAMLGSGWSAAIHPEDRARVFEEWEQSVKNRTVFLSEYRFQRPNGDITWVVGEAQAEGGPGEEVPGYVGTITDINERKQNESDLKHLNEELELRVEQRTRLLFAAKEQAEAASRAKSLFLTSLSHELRTPLNAILGYAQLMEITPELSRDMVENALEIKRAGNLLLDLMNDILDLARIESGRLEMQTETFALSGVLAECRSRNAQAAQARNITLLHDSLCDSMQVTADRRRLLQVLNNLFSNAIKYNREGGRVSVSCAIHEAGRLRLTVTDTGPGMTPGQQAQLFQPFTWMGAEMSQIEGVGIGLAVTRRLVEAMDGSIGVQSSPGSGSTFWVELPTPVQVVDSTQTAPASEGVEHIATSPRVLVAEDYAPNQTILRLQLQALGCEVDIADDGAAALEKWRTGRYDLILTDLNMPQMDGLELTRAVRQHERDNGGHIPIVAITAAAVRSELQRCREAGMDDVLTKPIALDGLRGVLARWYRSSIAEPAPVAALAAAPVGNKLGRDDATLDLDHLYRILGRVNLDQARDLVDTFIRSAGEGLDQLTAQANEGVVVAREMHKQKSSARTVGALRYAVLAEALEQQAKRESKSDTMAAMAELRLALGEVEVAATHLHAQVTHAQKSTAPVLATVICASVLVVDDDPVVLMQMLSMLASLGVTEVLTAGNGLEALKVMNERAAALEVLVCDLNMPEMDGVELIRRFGQTGFKGGLILMSGADVQILSTANKLAGLQGLRVLGQVQKPVAPDQMALLLARMLEAPVQKQQDWVTPQVTVNAIREGIDRDEFSVWFQPKVDTLSLKPVGVEALARWRREDGSYVPPDLFITVAERQGLIAELSQILVARALRDGARLHKAGFPLKIAINLSGRWLDDLNLPDLVLNMVHAAGLQVRDVVLEVTETGVMEDLTTALDVLTRLRLKGFGLSIDDFGIGYSSLEQLGRIPFTEMKLDRSFVDKGSQDAAARAILESSMDMAHKLGLATVAEGVETEAGLELVRTLGCDIVQGYLIAKPMPVDDLIYWLGGAGVA